MSLDSEEIPEGFKKTTGIIPLQRERGRVTAETTVEFHCHPTA